MYYDIAKNIHVYKLLRIRSITIKTSIPFYKMLFAVSEILVKDRQRFVDAVVSISVPDWSVKLSNFEDLLETPFEFGLRMLGFAKLFDAFYDK